VVLELLSEEYEAVTPSRFVSMTTLADDSPSSICIRSAGRSPSAICGSRIRRG